MQVQTNIGMCLLLFFLIRHHLWEYIGKVVLTFLFLAPQPLPSKAKDASPARTLVPASQRLLLRSSFTVMQKWVTRNSRDWTSIGPVLVARDMHSCPSFWLSVWLFWLREFLWVRKATLELSPLTRKLTVLIVQGQADWWDSPSLRALQSLPLPDQVSSFTCQNSVFPPSILTPPIKREDDYCSWKWKSHVIWVCWFCRSKDFGLQIGRVFH